MSKGFEKFGKIMAILLLVSFSLILNGFVFMQIWNWFMPHIGFNLITIPIALGLSTLIALLKNTNIAEKKTEKLDRIISIIVSPLFVLLFGWLIHLFI